MDSAGGRHVIPEASENGGAGNVPPRQTRQPAK